MFNKKHEAIDKRYLSSPFDSSFHFAKKEAKVQRKLQKIRQDYTRERTKQREHLNKELAVVEKLLEEGSISEDIRARYKKMLELGYTQKRRETREKYGFIPLDT